MKLFYALVLPLLLLLGAQAIHAEGTKEVMPNSTNGTGLIVSTSTSFPLGNVGSHYKASVDQRIYIRIKDFTKEVLYYGFNWETLGPAGTNIVPYTDVYMRIFDPSGNLDTTIRLPASGNGFISTWNSVAGPLAGAKIGGFPAAGYNPLNFTPTMNGDYYVTFYRSSDGGVTHNIAESMLSKYFDLTVASGTGAAAVRYPGRVHCNDWAFSVYSPGNHDYQEPQDPTNAQFFTYTPDSVIAKVYFPATGFEPLSYLVAFNNFGVKDNGNWLVDRKSIVLPTFDTTYLRGGYPVFLNRPDTNIWHVSALPNPPQLVSPTISGCPPGPYNIRFYAPQAGDYYMLMDLNGVSGYQANSADRFIELINQAPGIITYVWDGKDNLGNSVPSNTSFPITFSFRKGRINIPFYDVELNIYGFSVDGVLPQLAYNTTLYWDDTQLYNVDGSTVPPQMPNNYNTTGAGINNSIVGQKAPGHAWSGDGNPGMVIPAPDVAGNSTDNDQTNDFGNARLINTWAWGVELKTTQTLKLACISVSGTVWDDADGSAAGTFTNIQTNSEPGVNAGNSLYASLIDPISGKVLSTVAVAANGKYTLPNCPINASNMQVVISTTAGVVGGNAPTGNIPTTWINTSPLNHSFNSVDVDITGIDFGIEQLPNSVDQHYTIAVPIWNSSITLNGAGTIASPGMLKGSDPEDGALGSGKTVVITQVPSNEQLYYNGVLVTNNTTIPNYDPSKLTMKFISITVTSISFYYAYVDAAGKQDPSPAVYTIDMSSVLATTLGTFTGRAGDDGNILNWTGLNETNGAYFIIQRSVDGVKYENIGRVDGGTTGATGNHTFLDHQPAPGVINYYRIEVTDLSGGASYSSIVAINTTGVSSVVELAPNPFRDAITVQLNLAAPEKVLIRLLDSKGSLLRLADFAGIKGVNTLTLSNLSGLPVSVYFVQIVLADQTFVRKAFNRR
ncbi:MAG: T9SS type A sorting domain-containing protein [Chitinophagaceae bacterium]|nr:T9SS type A sorting domain-containing protein [Chitinophagaceae bacterium]